MSQMSASLLPATRAQEIQDKIGAEFLARALALLQQDGLKLRNYQFRESYEKSESVELIVDAKTRLVLSVTESWDF